MLIVNVNQIIDLGRFDIGIVNQIKDLDNALTVRLCDMGAVLLYRPMAQSCAVGDFNHRDKL